MEVDDFGITAFEDPAPKQTSSEVDFHLNDEASTIKLTKVKRRLRYRPEVTVTGKRYDGKRVSRADAELDTESLGLLDEEHDGEQESEEIAEPHFIDDDDEDDESEESTEGDEGDHDVGKGQSLAVQAENQREEEEKAIVERLAAARKLDERRAIAVRKQKSVYDAVVNMRIRLEPLMSRARLFSSKDQRSGLDEWSSNEDLTETLQSAHGALQSLIAQSEKIWRVCWPELDEAGSDKVFEEWRDTVLNQWGRKVSDASGNVPKGGFKAFDTSVSTQVKAAIKSGKHLDRTRRVKESLSLLGGLQLDAGENEMHFDDGEFYRTLLREIIETGDAPGGGLRHAQLSKEGRIKKKRTNSFAKGKRINYEVHDKMVGFLAPIPHPNLGPVDEIIANMFGKRRQVE